MVYLVYEYTLQKSRINAAVTSSEIKNVLYAGTDKSTAVSIFDNALHDHYVISNNDKLELMLAAFNSNTEPGRLVTKLEQFMVGKTKAAPPPPADKDALLKQIIANIHMAEYVYSLTHDGVNPLIKLTCADCGRALTTVLNKNITLSNESLCDICWSNYLTSDEGLAEYYLAIAMGKYSMSAFSNEELLKIIASWEARRNTLVNTGRFTEEQLSGIETAAKAIGLDEESLQPPADTPVTPKPEPDSIPVLLKVISPANKRHYLVGEKFDPAGMEFVVIYDDDSSKILGLDDVIIADGSALTADDSTIDIYYYDGAVQVATEFSIEVSKVIQGISIYTEPDNVFYEAGEIFDPTGMELKLEYSDGSYEYILPEQCIIPDMPLGVDVTSVDIVYWINDFKAYVPCPVYVRPAHSLVALVVTKQPDRLTYTFNSVNSDPFDPTGMEITAIYSDSTSTIINKGYEYSVHHAFSNNQNYWYVFISYTEKGITKAATVDLDVRADWLATSMRISQMPYVTTFANYIDLTGLAVEVSYEDGTVRTFTRPEVDHIGGPFTIEAVGELRTATDGNPIVSEHGDATAIQTLRITYTQTLAEEIVASFYVDFDVYFTKDFKVPTDMTLVHTNGNQKMYYVGDTIAPEDILVTVKYKQYLSGTNSNAKIITESVPTTSCVLEGEGAPGRPFTTTGSKPITVKYTENYITLSGVITKTVRA